MGKVVNPDNVEQNIAGLFDSLRPFVFSTKEMKPNYYHEKKDVRFFSWVSGLLILRILRI